MVKDLAHLDTGDMVKHLEGLLPVPSALLTFLEPAEELTEDAKPAVGEARDDTILHTTKPIAAPLRV